METLIFHVPGKPQSKARHRSFARAGRVCNYTPAQTEQYENWIKLCYQGAHGTARLVPPIEMSITAYFSVPKSYSKKKAALCRENVLRPTCKPDMDNIAKAVADALNGIAYHDDSGVSELHVSKQYGEREGLVVRLVGNLEEGQDAGKKTADAVQPLKKRE